jgi:soluble lytic murein transglycosylase
VLALLGSCAENGCFKRSLPSPAASSAATEAEPATPTPVAVQIGSNPVGAPPFAADEALRAVGAIAEQRWQEAATALSAYLVGERAPSDPTTRARARLLEAVAHAHLRNWAAAAAGFEYALEHLPVVGDYAGYQAARARYFAGETELALAHAGRVDASSIVGADAELLIGDVLRARADHRATASHYAEYLERRPNGIRRSEARYRLAEALEASGSAGPALVHYRTITIGDPLSSWAERAEKRVAELLKVLPARERSRQRQMSGAEHIERGQALYDAMRNEQSEAEFAAALKSSALTADQRCVAAYYRANSVFKARDRARAAPLFEEAITLCRRAKNVDLEVKGAYQAGRCYHNLGKLETAIARYQLIEDRHADHSYADDARVLRAQAYRELGDGARADELLAAVPKRYPDGDMATDALWQLAWTAYKAGDYPSALARLREQLELGPPPGAWWAEGQALYLMGRCHAKMGQTERAADDWEQTARRHPLSYYALLALNRLREVDEVRYAALTASLRAAPTAGQTADQPWQFRDRPVYQSAGFARALEFMRLGLGHEAEAELRRLGMAVPAGREPVTDPDRRDQLWAVAFLYDQAGRYETSHWLTRWHLLDYRTKWPSGPDRARWQIAYPRPFWQLLDRHARANDIPTELFISIVREESGFSPVRESPANAIGLSQLIVPTAERFARGTGIAVSRETLRDPELNATIGARFLGFLSRRFDGRLPLMVPAYNAGEGAVDRWLRERGHWPQDEWSEEIPYEEARKYAKRVLSSYFAYSYLGTGTIPRVRNDLPAAR